MLAAAPAIPLQVPGLPLADAPHPPVREAAAEGKDEFHSARESSD